jgi:hypothetical protein
VVMDYFGGRNIGELIGILYTSAGFGTLIGPAAAGFAFDFAHSYLIPHPDERNLQCDRRYGDGRRSEST